MTELVIGWLQHLDGILDSSSMAWIMRIRKQVLQYVCEQGRVWYDLAVVNSSQQQTHDLHGISKITEREGKPKLTYLAAWPVARDL